jgi:hypothetical protein
VIVSGWAVGWQSSIGQSGPARELLLTLAATRPEETLLRPPLCRSDGRISALTLH